MSEEEVYSGPIYAGNVTGTEFTTYDVQTLTSICLFFAGNADSRWWRVPSSQSVQAVADYYNLNTEQNPEDVMKLLGWSENVFYYLDEVLGGLNFTAPYYSELLPIMPHPQNGNYVVPTFAAFTAISTIVLLLRLWSRASIAGRIQAFDWCTVLAYFLIVGWGAFSVYEFSITPWANICDQTWLEYHAYERAYGILMFSYPLVILTVKASLLLFYHQLSAWLPLRIGVYITAFICFGNAIAASFTWLFQCKDYPNMWDHAVDVNMYCELMQMPIVLSTGGISIATDLIIWLIPMPLVFKLQLSAKERILAVFTFGIGLIACVGSVMRLLAIKRYLYYGEDATDAYDSRQPINCWTIVEMNLALICSCVPALRALVIKHAPKLISSGSSDHTGSSGTKASSNYKGHGKPSLISEEDGPAASELADYSSRHSDSEKPNPNVKVWSPITNYQTEHVERR